MALSEYFQPTKNGDTAFAVEAPKIKFGKGCLAEIGADARALGIKRAALYTDLRVTKLRHVSSVPHSNGSIFVVSSNIKELLLIPVINKVKIVYNT